MNQTSDPVAEFAEQGARRAEAVARENRAAELQHVLRRSAEREDNEVLVERLAQLVLLALGREPGDLSLPGDALQPPIATPYLDEEKSAAAEVAFVSGEDVRRATAGEWLMPTRRARIEAALKKQVAAYEEPRPSLPLPRFGEALDAIPAWQRDLTMSYERCGRCGGGGRVDLRLKDGAPSEETCRACRGRGVVETSPYELLERKYSSDLREARALLREWCARRDARRQALIAERKLTWEEAVSAANADKNGTAEDQAASKEIDEYLERLDRVARERAEHQPKQSAPSVSPMTPTVG